MSGAARHICSGAFTGPRYKSPVSLTLPTQSVKMTNGGYFRVISKSARSREAQEKVAKAKGRA